MGLCTHWHIGHKSRSKVVCNQSQINIFLAITQSLTEMGRSVRFCISMLHKHLLYSMCYKNMFADVVINRDTNINMRYDQLNVPQY